MPVKLDFSKAQPVNQDSGVKLDFSKSEPIATSPVPQSNWGTISQAPDSGWLDDLNNDLREGGSRTFIGRALGHAQGRGDKGFTGLESGQPKGVADFVGSVPLGAVKYAKGVAELHNHPVKGALDQLGGLLQVGTIPLSFVGGPAAEGMAAKVAGSIPSKSTAGDLLASVSREAGGIPVDLNRSADAILRVRELADAGASMPQSINKLLLRVTKPGSKPLTYDEARDFYQNITALSAKDKMGLSPTMKRQIGIVANNMKQDIGDAAAQVGKSAEYYKGMKQYANASRLQRAATTMLKEFGIPLAKYAALGAAAGEAGKSLLDNR